MSGIQGGSDNLASEMNPAIQLSFRHVHAKHGSLSEKPGPAPNLDAGPGPAACLEGYLPRHMRTKSGSKCFARLPV